MTIQEAEDFKVQSMPQLKDIDVNSSLKSNFMILSRNFKILLDFLTNLKSFSLYTNSIVEATSNSKTKISIDPTLEFGQIDTQIANKITYKVTRIDKFVIEITNATNSNWSVDDLFLQVKDANGVIVYPAVSTISNKITINFIDGISSDYYIYFS